MITKLTYNEIETKYQFDKHIWEGWRVRDFIAELEPTLDRIMEYGRIGAEPGLKTKEAIKDWVRWHLPYTTKALREVTKYFVDKYNGMPAWDWNSPKGWSPLRLK